MFPSFFVGHLRRRHAILTPWRNGCHAHGLLFRMTADAPLRHCGCAIPLPTTYYYTFDCTTTTTTTTTLPLGRHRRRLGYTAGPPPAVPPLLPPRPRLLIYLHAQRKASLAVRLLLLPLGSSSCVSWQREEREKIGEREDDFLKAIHSI